MDDYSNTDIHDEIALLLPWYVNETLHDSEWRRVENHARDCSECQDALSLLRSIDSAVTVDAPAPIVPAPRVQDLLGSVRSQRPTRPIKTEWTKNAIAASIITIAITALLYFANDDDQYIDSKIFETATSTQTTVTMDVVLDIRFDEASDADARTKLLEALNAEIQASSKNGEEVRAILKFPASSLEELESRTKQIAAMPPIRSVELVALQLPVRNQE